jgi:hypothetical protein
MAVNNSLIVITVTPIGTDVPGIGLPTRLPLEEEAVTLQSFPHMIWIKFQHTRTFASQSQEGVAATESISMPVI